ncbi:regulator of volume decrease after cellular swelling-domain-containing protein [Fimicolochytrium jonesii]|uniref:regulator of volume decrease after cellular swelling-domain-containing protein n=1 Tax=Fimicolochytrium jonesii TaxID=1396493 RepID=UPI0022FF4194|nr:regulator of volume decrease after cellular swelling-domain-containing protein [Fimicolochytrium jonesii]KAI8819047.1 regulator of volume decrease after cellular swelling-domain-containing protein [Fimicolochytrium jonesii]
MPIDFSLTYPDFSQVRHMQRDVTIVFTPVLEEVGNDCWTGDVYVAESQLILHDPDDALIISIDYPSIGIHAVSRHGDDVIKLPHIYAELDASVAVDSVRMGEDRVDVGEMTVREMRIVVEDGDALDVLYQFISNCASLHPDPISEDADISSNEDDENEWYTTPEQMENLTAEQQKALDHFAAVFTGPYPDAVVEGQFDDAMEDM